MVQVLALFVPYVLKPPAPAPRRAFEVAKQNRSSRRATVWQQNPNSRRCFWESSHRVKAADSALGAKSQIKVADVALGRILGLRDISVREVATVTPFAVDGPHSFGFAWRGLF